MQHPPRTAASARARTAAIAAAAVFAVPVLAAGCLDDELDPYDPANAQTFIASESNFQSFRSWPHVEVGAADVAGGHAAGERTAYYNPPPSGGSFPVGTIIVKTTETGSDPTLWQVHARVKRGGGYNASGAVNWEWLALDINADGSVRINWQGTAPPKNHGYESLPGLGAGSSTDGDCNACHGLAQSHDYVLSQPLVDLLGS